jgi:hypothetical protein
MGPITKAAGGAAAAMLIQAGMTAAPPVANAQPVEIVPCSTSRLISAITSANNVGGRILRLAPRCDYVLRAPAQTGENGPDGLPIITGNITLVGGPNTRISRAATAPEFRLIELGTGGVLKVRNIFLSGGRAPAGFDGGAIENFGTAVELSHTTVTGNRARFAGGIDNIGKLVVNASLISGNTATVASGGGIWNSGRLSINFSRLTGNSTTVREGAGLQNDSGVANIFRSTFDHNHAATEGGGIFTNGAQARLSLIRTLVVRNTANNAGGVRVASGTLTPDGSIIRFNIPNDCVGAGCP